MSERRYPPIGDYGLIADCHSAALVSKSGSIDWCCMPRLDAGSVFGRLLDWERAGHWAIRPVDESYEVERRYVGDTLVLATTFTTDTGRVTVSDLFAMHRGGAMNPYNQLIRIIEGIEGEVLMRFELRPRFDYGEVRPWLRRHGRGLFTMLGGDEAYMLCTNLELEHESHDLEAEFEMSKGKTRHAAFQFHQPHLLEASAPKKVPSKEVSARVDRTLTWWKTWLKKGDLSHHGHAEIRCALTIKALTHAPTGAIAAAPTTSLPEQTGGSLNWDYRYSWIRDSSLAVRSLGELGYTDEADGFRRFVERSAAGHAQDLQIMYGLYGERRLHELELDLEGYRRASPVRVGNEAARQLQLDAYGELLQLAWRWFKRGRHPDDYYWDFLVTLVDEAAVRWEEPDAGIWEERGPGQHHVLSKAMCWSAIDRGLAMAKELDRKAPTSRWKEALTAIRESIEANGVNIERNCYTQTYWRREMDASLLLLPQIGYVDWNDDKMVATTDAVRNDLSVDGTGLLYRYRRSPDENEGAFLCCSFWLVECLVMQGRKHEAREIFDHVVSLGNDLGLMAEEYDPEAGEMLGNYPLALTHLAHLAAAIELEKANA